MTRPSTHPPASPPAPHEHDWERGKHMAEAFGVDGRNYHCAICGEARIAEPPPQPTGPCVQGHPPNWRLEGRRWRCRDCRSARDAKRQGREEYRSKKRTKQRAWAARNPEKVNAHRIVRDALVSGRLMRPESCDRCGKTGTVQASHTDYARPLDVEWLCPMCHGAKDSSMRRAA